MLLPSSIHWISNIYEVPETHGHVYLVTLYMKEDWLAVKTFMECVTETLKWHAGALKTPWGIYIWRSKRLVKPLWGVAGKRYLFGHSSAGEGGEYWIFGFRGIVSDVSTKYFFSDFETGPRLSWSCTGTCGPVSWRGSCRTKINTAPICGYIVN